MQNHKLDKEIEGYAFKFFAKNLWKIRKTHDMDDAMQEARLLYMKCDERYPDVESKHFMALFKTTLTNWTINQAEKCSRTVHDALYVASDDDYRRSSMDQDDGVPGDLDNDGYLRCLVRQAPSEVRAVLSLFLCAPSELLEAAMGACISTRNAPAGGNEHVSRLLGLPEGSKPLDAVRAYFG